MRIEFEVDVTPVRYQRPRPSQPPPSPAEQVGRVVRYLVLAWQIERAVAEGRAKDFSDVADQLGLSRARVSQVMNLRFLSPRIQEVLLTEPHRAGRISERRLRSITETLDWSRQWAMFRPMLTAAEGPTASDHADPVGGQVTLESATTDDSFRVT